MREAKEKYGFVMRSAAYVVEVLCESEEQSKKWIAALSEAAQAAQGVEVDARGGDTTLEIIEQLRPQESPIGSTHYLKSGGAEHKVKVAVVGDHNVGKTSITHRFCKESRLDESPKVTIGIDYYVKRVEFDGSRLRLAIWDTAGQEQFNCLASSYYRDAQIVLIVFDCSKKWSPERCSHWIQQARNYCNLNVVFMLVANKVDLIVPRTRNEKYRSFADEENILFAETSAKTGEGIQNAFERICRSYMELPTLHAFGGLGESFILGSQKSTSKKTDSATPDDPSEHQRKCCGHG